MSETDETFAAASISRDRDRFLREMIRELTGVLEEAVGLEDASGFVAVVGGRLGEMMDREYRKAAGVERLDLDQLAAALVDLKRRIEGGFVIQSVDDEKIVLNNSRCPFGSYVHGRESLCMTTSNVFGRIAANNMGYARVDIEKAIARGDAGCRVVVYFRDGDAGREYFG